MRDYYHNKFIFQLYGYMYITAVTNELFYIKYNDMYNDYV